MLLFLLQTILSLPNPLIASPSEGFTVTVSDPIPLILGDWSSVTRTQRRSLSKVITQLNNNDLIILADHPNNFDNYLIPTVNLIPGCSLLKVGILSITNHIEWLESRTVMIAARPFRSRLDESLQLVVNEGNLGTLALPDLDQTELSFHVAYHGSAQVNIEFQATGTTEWHILFHNIVPNTPQTDRLGPLFIGASSFAHAGVYRFLLRAVTATGAVSPHNDITTSFRFTLEIENVRKLSVWARRNGFGNGRSEGRWNCEKCCKMTGLGAFWTWV
jgi:hypothetical protein